MVSLVDLESYRHELDRVTAARSFATAGRLSQFLRYIVEESLAGRGEQIKEYSIGLAVYGKPAGYDPKIDATVRGEASRLRSRLLEYYAGEGQANPIRIEIPKGSYVPRFVLREPEPAAHANNTAPTAAPPVRHCLWRWTSAALACAGILALAAALLIRPRAPSAPLLRLHFTLDPPEDAGFLGPPAISPDGQHVVCSIRTKSGETAIWHRSLAAVAGKILPGTNGEWPSWSEDGRLVLYNDEFDVRLRKFDVSTTRPPETVPVPRPLYAVAWTREDVVLIPRGEGIVKMHSSGGAGVPVTHLDQTHGEKRHLWPQLLPDGRHFLYFAASRNPSESAIRLGSLDGKVQKRLLPNESRGQYVPSIASDPERAGYLLYVQRGTLFARSLDPRKLEFTGSAKPVVEGVGQSHDGIAHFAGSQNGVLVYKGSTGAGAQFTWFDRTGRELGHLGPPGACANPAFSPDGRTLAFDFPEGSNRDIWTTDITSGLTRRLTFDPDNDHDSLWSPDGRQIAFGSHRSGFSSLLVKPANGETPERRLVPWTPGPGSPDSWSPDGTALLFSHWGETVDIWLLPLNEKQKPVPWLQTRANEYYAKFSPDGKWVAYTSDETGREEIYVQSFENNSPARGGKWMVSVNGGAQPSWRADGKELYYLSATNKLMTVAVTSHGVFQAATPKTATGLPTVLREGPRNDYAVTPDGQRFLVKTPWTQHPAPSLQVLVNWAAALR